jgi:TonB-dependent starch-binding outer membrane protein SusC
MTKLSIFYQNPLRFLPKKFHVISLVVFILILVAPVFGQQANFIKGKVIDEKKNEPLIGVNIRIKGSPSGTLTDFNGEFTLSTGTELPITLIISYIGYKYQEIAVYENEPITAILSEDINRINEVVVIGYGTKKREELTGSITSIPVSALKQSSSASFDNALQGRATGVQVTSSSGAPGAAVSIRIRGGNSITGGNEPLYVIDGFPVYNNNNDVNAGALEGLNRPNINALATINPGDIESIDVLKDASATAIYGSRGANGVIILTTKKGRTGSNSVTYDYSYGVQRISKTIDLLNAREWAILKNDARANSGKSPLFSVSQIDSLGGHNNDWQSAAFRKAPVQNHQLSFSGGSDKTRYAISIGYLDQKGILIGTSLNRYSARVSLDTKLSEKFNVGVNINGSVSRAGGISEGVILSTLTMPPTVPIKDANGVYTFQSPYESAVSNPIATLNLFTSNSKINRVLGSTYAEYEIVHGLKAKVLIGADLLTNKQNRYLPSSLYEGKALGGLATVGTKFTNNWLNENTLTYVTTFNKVHGIEILAGFTQQQSESEGAIASAQGFTNDILMYNDLYSGTTVNKPQSSYSSWALQSYLGRLNYNYSQKYYVTASIRADGSSRLGKNHRWGYFPSGSLAWQINKESFLEPLKGTISNLKLRISAGLTGNQEISPYESLSLLTGYPYPTASGTLTGYASARVSNPDLKWETTAQYDGGLDIGLIDERIKVILDVYYKKTTDLLLSVPLPTSSGYSSSLQNIGSVQNKGLEIALNTINTKGKFGWTTDVSFSLNRNKVLSIGNGADYFLVTGELQTASVVKVGEPLGSFWGFKTNGLIRNSDDLANTLLFAPYSTQKGDVKFRDINGDSQITQAGDQTIIGNAEPKFIYGLGNNFSFYNFDLSVFFQGSYGNKIYSGILQELQLTTGYQNGIKGLADHWTINNDDAKYPRANENLPATPKSDLFIYDGSYVRLKNITLSYNVPNKFASKVKINKLRLYLSAQNLITWASYPGYDPEVNYFDNSTQQGFDYSAYPSSKTILAGISLTF